MPKKKTTSSEHTTSSKNPIGLEIGSAKNPWRIGKLLGKGACGSVHELIPPPLKNNSLQYVVKLATLPPILASQKKGKSKKSAMERNADLLSWERTMYHGTFNRLRGVVIPDTCRGAKAPPVFGEIDGEYYTTKMRTLQSISMGFLTHCFFFPTGFRFLAMERMASPLSSITSHFLSPTKKSKNTALPIGDFAASMVHCIEQIHQSFFLFVDVKSENFMFSQQISPSNIRLLDFGLVESFHDMMSRKQRPDLFPNAEFVGTPIYASINVLQGHTVSRRDDLESIVYITMEIILSLIEGSAEEMEYMLPWSKGTSDRMILDCKLQSISDTNSDLFQRLKDNGRNDDMADKLFSLLSYIRNLEYDKTPDYERIKREFKLIKVQTGNTKYSSDRKTPSTASRKTINNVTERSKAKSTSSTANNKKNFSTTREKKTSRTASSRTNDNGSTKTLISGKQQDDSQNVNIRRSKRLAKTQLEPEEPVIDVGVDDDDVDIEVLSIQSSDEENYNTIQQQRSLRSQKSKHKKKKTEETSSSSSSTQVQMIFQSGPHKGETFVVSQNHPVIIGRQPDMIKCRSNPVLKKQKIREQKHQNKTIKHNTFYTEQDPEMSSAHLQLECISEGGVGLLRVTDLKSSNGTYIGENKITSATFVKVGDTISAGNSILLVQQEIERKGQRK